MSVRNAFHLNSLVVGFQTLSDGRRRRRRGQPAAGLEEGEGRGLLDLPPVELDLGHLGGHPRRDVRNGVGDEQLQHHHQVLEPIRAQCYKTFAWNSLMGKISIIIMHAD